MNPNWNDAVPPWQKPKTAQTSNALPSQGGRAATASADQSREWATTSANIAPRGSKTATPMTASKSSGRRMRGSYSSQGLASVGLGNFKIGALHDVIKSDVESDGGFFPGGLGVPENFQGDQFNALHLHRSSALIPSKPALGMTVINSQSQSPVAFMLHQCCVILIQMAATYTLAVRYCPTHERNINRVGATPSPCSKEHHRLSLLVHLQVSARRRIAHRPSSSPGAENIPDGRTTRSLLTLQARLHFLAHPFRGVKNPPPCREYVDWPRREAVRARSLV